MPFARFARVVALAWFAACGGQVTTNSDAGVNTNADTGAATCSWSSIFEPLDATPMRDSCRAARMLVMCTGSDGSNAGCLSYEEKCDLPARPGVSYTCKNQCKSTEFAATCGTLMGSSVTPPADCPQKFLHPEGIDYCCACSP